MSQIAEETCGITDPLEGFLGYRLRRASSAAMADLAASLAAIDLRPTEASILLVVEANPRATQADIGRALGVKRANMAPLTASLREKKLIDSSPVDGRSHGLRLTRTGANLAASAREVMRSHDLKYFGALDQNARNAFEAALEFARNAANGEENGEA